MLFGIFFYVFLIFFKDRYLRTVFYREQFEKPARKKKSDCFCFYQKEASTLDA